MLALAASPHGLGGLQPLPAPMAVLVGLAALAVVALEEIWQTVQHVYTIAHEGAHALTGIGFGHKIVSVQVNRNGTGLTKTLGPRHSGGVAVPFAGYVGPSAFGLLGAWLISRGEIAAVLWLAVVLLIVVLPVLSGRFGFVPVIVTGGLLFVVALYTTAGVETVVAYGLTWFLLLSGLRVVVAHGRGAFDAGILRNATHLPRALWALLWLIGTVAALIFGGSLLV